jgi:hypothetical protein
VVYTDDVGGAALLDQRADDTGLGQCQSGKRGNSDQGRMHLERKIELRERVNRRWERKELSHLPYMPFIYPGCERGRTTIVLH